MKGLGVYIHIPFCIRKCYYCDFCSFSDRDGRKMRDYTEELCRRIELSPQLRGREVDTLYFGGGTPTLLPIELFEKIMGIVRAGVNGNIAFFFVAHVVRHEEEKRGFKLRRRDTPALYDIRREYITGGKRERRGKFYAIFT